MREIINLQVGQCGNQIGCKFWDVISEEHGIDCAGFYRGDKDVQLTRVHGFYDEQSRGNYVPRAVLMDLGAGQMDQIRAGHQKAFFGTDSYIFSKSSAGGVFAKGFYSEGQEQIETILDNIRQQIEECDSPQGFQMAHSISGGTGSGLGTLLISKLREEFPDLITSTHSIFPSLKVSDAFCEPYNATFAMHQLIENCDLNICLDNEALFDICVRSLKIKSPTYNDLNHLVSHSMSSATCSLRFPGQLNQDLRKLCVNLVNFRRLHFMTSSMAPFHTKCRSVPVGQPTFDVAELTSALFDYSHSLCAADPSQGVYATAYAMFRGPVAAGEVDTQIAQFQNKRSELFKPWIPDNVSTAMCDIAPKDIKVQAGLIANHTAIKEVFRRIGELFTARFRRKANIHYYTSEGMDEMQFTEAESNLNDLISEFYEWGGGCPYDSDEIEYDEEEME